MDTIFALATPQGRAGVSVVRVSGTLARAAGLHLAGTLPEPRRMALRTLVVGGDEIDRALVVWFEAGRSFTGEDVVEFHLHGSLAVIAAVLRALEGIEGLRPAEAGEFTRRAFDSGMLDFSQVEGLSDLLVAETEAQRRQAIRLFSGALGSRVEDWRQRLIRALALIEATIDFADEEIPDSLAQEVDVTVTSVICELRKEAAGFGLSERVREGFEVAIVGPPNVGKSTLLNRLAGREAAITSEIAGTTRDVIEVRMDINGLAVTFLDTAGVRDTEDQVESIGILRAVSRAERADLRIFLSLDGDIPRHIKIEDEDIILRAKCDLSEAIARGVSGTTGAGVPELLDRINRVLAPKSQGATLITHLRHKRAVDSAIELLESARSALRNGESAVELVAEDLRLAMRALESLIGRVDVESVLSDIFSTFCIGK